MSNSMSEIPAIVAAKGLAAEAVGEAPDWQSYLEGVGHMAQELWNIPDAPEQDRTRWITYLYIDTAVEVSASISADKREEIGEKAEALLAKHGISREEGEDVNLDVVTDISGTSNDIKTMVAASIVSAGEEYKDNKEALSAMKERFNAHASGIQPGDVPASLYKKMTATIERLNKLEP